MLTFKQLTFENFGPYKGVQKIKFPTDKGIVIIRGKNGRGKTSILSALRFVLFGSVKLNGKKSVELVNYINILSKNEGNYSFKVILDVELNENTYEITRTFSPRPGVLVPETDRHYLSPQVFIKETDKSGKIRILPDPEIKRILNQIMDEHVARFYLFDGELLKEYESQLMGEPDAGSAKIKEGIENILGVPILTNAKDHVDFCYKEYHRYFENITKSNDKTKEIGNAIETANSQLDECLIDIDSSNKDLISIRDELTDIQDRLENSATDKQMFEEQIQIENNVKTLKEQIAEKEDERNSELQTAWEGLLSPILNKQKDSILVEINSIKDLNAKKKAQEDTIKKLRASIETNRCDFCKRPLDDEAYSTLCSLLEEQSNECLEEYDPKFYADRLLILQSQSKYIDTFANTSSVSTICTLEYDIGKKSADLVFAENDLEEINEKVEKNSLSREEFNSLTTCRDKLKQREYNTLEGLNNTKIVLKNKEDLLKKLDTQLKRVAGEGEVEIARRKKEFVMQLLELIKLSIFQYQEDLKIRVQEDATSLFTQLSNEKEYTGLKINENYGLEIIHQDGTEIPLRSSGYEHLVAFSLIGALHNNAPLSGPLFMDTSFGRLDQENSQNLIQILPKLSEQVILLVHDREIDEKQARWLIPDAIKANYTIERVSARESCIRSTEGGF